MKNTNTKNKKRNYRRKSKPQKNIEFKVENQKKTVIDDIKALEKLRKQRNYRPKAVDQIETHVRKGEMVRAVKKFKDITGSPLVPSKEAVDLYRETGNWNHWQFSKNNNLLDLAFKKVCGNDPKTFEKNQDNEIYDRAKAANTPIVSVNMALRIAVQYAQLLKDQRDI